MCIQVSIVCICRLCVNSYISRPPTSNTLCALVVAIGCIKKIVGVDQPGVSNSLAKSAILLLYLLLWLYTIVPSIEWPFTPHCFHKLGH